jgi:hypothetical protein
MPTFDDVRSIAMALPEVEEKLTWGSDVTFRIRDKMFIVGGDGSEGITLKASITMQAELIDLDPETFSVAAYVGRFGWVNIQLDRVDRGMLEQLVRDAWRSTAPKSMRDRVLGG